MPKNKESSLPFKLLILYILFEYARPQDLILRSILTKLHPGWVLSLSLLWCMWKEGKLKFDLPQVKSFLGLIILMILHLPFCVNNYAAYQILRATIVEFIFFLSIITYVSDYELLIKFIKLWLKVIILCAIIGIKNHGKIPNSGFMGDENDFALVMNMAIGMTYFLYFYEENLKTKIFYIFSACLYVIAVIASFSRGGFVGFAGIVFIIWLKSSRKILSFFILIIIISVFIAYAPSSYWKEIETIKQEGLHSGTGGARWYLWKLGFKMFLDHPIWGVGPGNFPWTVGKYEPKEEHKRYQERSHYGRVAHSLYVTVLTELGVVGTFLYFSIFYRNKKDLSPLFRFEKYFSDIKENKKILVEKLRIITYAIECAIMGYFFCGIFLTVCYYPHYWFFNALMICIKQTFDKIIKS